MNTLSYNYYDSPIGTIELASDGQTLLWAKFLETQKSKKLKQTETDLPIFKQAKTQLDAYFNHELESFDLPLDIHGTAFQKLVWQKLCLIPFGKTISYLTLSKQIGDVKAIRAVASTNGKNNFCVIIPCHRVISSNGSLTGYAGDLWRKKWLLDHETKHTNPQTSLFL